METALPLASFGLEENLSLPVKIAEPFAIFFVGEMLEKPIQSM